MALQSNRLCEPGQQQVAVSRALCAGLHDFNQQCLRILCCTAKAMANSPGGLRFKAGTRPWLEGLATVPVRVANGSQRISIGLPTASD